MRPDEIASTLRATDSVFRATRGVEPALRLMPSVASVAPQMHGVSRFADALDRAIPSTRFADALGDIGTSRFADALGNIGTSRFADAVGNIGTSRFADALGRTTNTIFDQTKALDPSRRLANTFSVVTYDPPAALSHGSFTVVEDTDVSPGFVTDVFPRPTRSPRAVRERERSRARAEQADRLRPLAASALAPATAPVVESLPQEDRVVVELLRSLVDQGHQRLEIEQRIADSQEGHSALEWAVFVLTVHGAVLGTLSFFGYERTVHALRALAHAVGHVSSLMP